MSIQILSSDVINQIAAGEVVERPSHLVKELVENSLDAGSDKISIEVANGGRTIYVQDNGSGIKSSELSMALQRHATSKINKTDDLWNLSSFGFRGEALASAAAVSKMTLKSFEKVEKKPAQIGSVFGNVSIIKPSSQTVGTTIEIDELFENVPARLKFLKSDAAEIAQIKTVVKALALSQPSVEFKLTVNGELQLFYPRRGSHVDRASDVLEKKNLFEVKNELGSFKCHIIFASPHDVAKTSKQIWIFAQKRWVHDRAIQAAVMDAYRSLLMHGEYPYAVVWLDCAPDEIDVNIHPTKSQVKFQDSSMAFRAVHTTLRSELEKAPWLGGGAIKTGVNSFTNSNHVVGVRGEVYQEILGAGSNENLKFFDHSFEKTQFKNKNFNMGLQNYSELKVAGSAIGLEQVENVEGGYWSSLEVIGQANLTYIICQKEDRLVLVDQHAAHERVVYESLMRDWKKNSIAVQDYLFPLGIDLSEEKVEALLSQTSEITKMGFSMEQLGPNVIGIKAAPHLVKDSCLPAVFEKMAQEIIQNGGSFSIEKKISDLFATMACHSVIRAGQSLSVPEMQELLRSMDEFTLSSFCPHGRPVSVDKTFNELEKLFGRIN